MTLEIKEQSTKMKAGLQGETPVVFLKINASFSIVEVNEIVDLTDPNTLKQIEASVSSAIEKEIQASLKKAQKELKADIFGFGEEFERSLNKEWPLLKINWEKNFAQLVVDIEIKSQVVRSGDKLNPSHPKS